MKETGLFEESCVIKYLEHVLLKGESKYPATLCLAAEVLGVLVNSGSRFDNF